jgi:hypothetical protein
MIKCKINLYVVVFNKKTLNYDIVSLKESTICPMSDTLEANKDVNTLLKEIFAVLRSETKEQFFKYFNLDRMITASSVLVITNLIFNCKFFFRSLQTFYWNNYSGIWILII